MQEAEKAPSEAYRDLLMRRVSQIGAASRVKKWLASPELRTGEPRSPIIMHAADALRRARQLPVGAARNDLRKLARGLRKLHLTGDYSVESPPAIVCLQRLLKQSA